jgi:uncharacterized membrane protein YkvA (DUF1232 family)
MTKLSTDLRQQVTEELTEFVQRQARSLSLIDIEELIADLPVLRERFAKISSNSYPYLGEQLQFLSQVVEDLRRRDPAGETLGEAAFALIYFQRAIDLIPDSIPGMGLLDDALIVHIVLDKHEQEFKSGPYGDRLVRSDTSFDIDQLLAIVSPLRLTSFCLSMTNQATSGVTTSLRK